MNNTIIRSPEYDKAVAASKSIEIKSRRKERTTATGKSTSKTNGKISTKEKKKTREITTIGHTSHQPPYK
jgi:hypothetical protein